MNWDIGEGTWKQIKSFEKLDKELMFEKLLLT